MSSNTSARTLWVKNLSQPSETATTNLFAPLGGSLRKVINTKDPTRQDVLIEFASEELASKALSTVQGSLVDGTRLIVEYAPTNLTAISSSIEKTFSQKGSVLDRIIKMSNTNHPKFDEKPEVQSSRKETAGNLKGETDSPVKDLTEHWKGEINGKSDKMEEIYDQENPSASQDGKLRKIISTKAQKHLDNNPLRRLVLIPKKKGSKRQEKKKQKKEVKLLIKRHPESILNLQPAIVAAHTTSENLESKQDLSQNVKNKDTTDPLNAQNITQTDNQPKNELKMSKERSSSKNYNKSRRSPSNHNIRSRSRERSRSGSFYRSRSYRDHSYSNQRDHRYYDGSRYRDPSPHYRHRSRSTSSQRRYDYRSKPDYKRRSSRDFSPRRRSYSRSWSPRSRISPCGSRCCHSRSRSGSYNRSIDRSLSPNSRSRKLVIKKRDGSIRHNHAQRGERSLSRDRNRKRSDSRDRSRSKERLARNQYKQGPGTSNLRRDRNMSNKHAKGGNGYLKKRRGGKKKQNRRFNQNPKQEETAGSRNSAVVNMPEITTNTSQLSINYLIFPSLQNFFPNNMLDIPNAHANQQEGCSDTTLPSYLCPQAKPDHVGGFEAEGPESSYKDVNRLNLQSDHKFIYPKVEEHSNSFELSTIESKSHLADYDKTFDRPQTNSGSPERSKNVEVKAEEEGEKPKTDYLLTNELVSKNNLRSFINYLVATGDVQGLKEKLKSLEKSK